MTLIITELSKFGIAMVADSAVTLTQALPSGKERSRVLNGAQKLQIIPYLKAGVSVWGLGEIHAKSGSVATDIWLGDFIERYSGASSISEFANCLVQELQIIIGDVQTPIGFHLAGFEDIDQRKLPTFHHVRNVDGTYRHYDFHQFIPGQDFPPRELADDEEPYLTRNGDYGPYALMSEAIEYILPRIQAIGLEIPAPSLRGRIAYHSAWVRFVSELYASSDLLKTIGGSVAGLGIYPDGRMDYYPSV